VLNVILLEPAQVHRIDLDLEKKNRRFLMKAIIVTMIIFGGYLIFSIAMGGVALAYFGPSHPGSPVFPIQDFAEQQMRVIYTDPVRKADYLLNLMERRINDLSMRIDSRYELISIGYLEKSLDQATVAISSAQQGQSDDLRRRLTSLALRTQEVLTQLKRAPIEDMNTYDRFQAKIQTLMHMTSANHDAKSVQVLIPTITARHQNQSQTKINMVNSAKGLIPFPQGSLGASHDFYPLIGQHMPLTCESCHNLGKYAGTANQCILCHVLKLPLPHYIGECGLCHTPVSWTDIHFEHATVSGQQCQSCHDRDEPVNHYRGECSACHITQAWNIVTFDHAVAGAVDCISCHVNDNPANHYPGQCSNCHDTTNWTSAVFNHSGFTDCLSCHRGDAPANHYSGQCSNCHDSGGSWANARFNHSGYSDCAACHSGNTPANHYAGQCSNCHSTNSWGGASFSHAGFTDCISCHQKDRPREHDSGQCSECHNTGRWEEGDDSARP
jgi:hypothetical protein